MGAAPSAPSAPSSPATAAADAGFQFRMWAEAANQSTGEFLAGMGQTVVGAIGFYVASSMGAPVVGTCIGSLCAAIARWLGVDTSSPWYYLGQLAGFFLLLEMLSAPAVGAGVAGSAVDILNDPLLVPLPNGSGLPLTLPPGGTSYLPGGAGKASVTGSELIADQDQFLPLLPEDAPVPLGRGSTGDYVPRNHTEELLMTQARTTPEMGKYLPKVPVNEARWHQDDGWQKMQMTASGTVVHYLYNPALARLMISSLRIMKSRRDDLTRGVLE